MTQIVSVFIVLLIYFFPVLAAISNKNPNKVSIGLLNFFLGWTLVGWVIALVWAYKK